MSGEIRDVTIVGAGPVGLCAGFWAGMREASCHIVEALGAVGGQCAALYPDKWIFDVPGHPRVQAGELVARLREQALDPFDAELHLETTAESIDWEGEGEERVVVLRTSSGELRSRTLVVAGGHGAFEPKPLPGGDADVAAWEGRGVRYLVRDKAELAGRRVTVVGGGDSACDWALNLLDTAEHVTLVHRRDGFRAHERTVTQVREAAAAGRLELLTGCVVRELDGRERLERLTVAPADGEGPRRELRCDALLLQLGFTTKLGPLAEWGFTLVRNAIRVDGRGATGLERVWACGDVATHDAKIKLIATGFGEAAVAIAEAVHALRPGTRLQPAYSTNTGVPTSS